MINKKKLVRRLIAWLIALAAIAAIVVFIGIPIFAVKEDTNPNPPKIAYYDGKAKTVTLENDDLLFEMDTGNTQFTVTDKASGHVWYSNPAGAASDPVALAAAKELMQSTLVVTMQTSSGAQNLNNFGYSIADQLYTIETGDDGTITVNYTIGKIEKTYCIPVCISVERYNQFIDAMGSKNAKKVKSNYSLYDPAKLDGKADKDEILTFYPIVAEQPMYILKSDTKEKLKKNLEEYFAAGGYTQEDYELDLQNVAGASDKTGAVYNVSMMYRLDGRDLVVEVPYNSIRYKTDYPITYVSVLPAFGASSTQDEGYMLVPEGGGALIRYNNGKLSQSSYYSNVYGWDWGTERPEVVNETRANFPVFGMLQDDASFLCIMDEGSAFGSIQSDISMRLNSYNTVYARYAVLHSDKYNVSNKTEQLVYVYERQIPSDVVVRQRYSFVTGGNYVDLANAYGTYLSNTYPEFASAQASDDMPVAVELIGAIDKTVVKFGLPVDSIVATTTFSQAEEIMTGLKDAGVKNMSISYNGWSRGGVNQQVLSTVASLNELGGQKAMDSLIAKAREAGVPVSFTGLTCFAYDSGLFQGFLAFRDAARLTTREQVQVFPYDNVTYQQYDGYDPFYLVSPEYAQDKANNLIKFLSSKKAYGVSFRDIGFLLSADYNKNNTVSRETVKNMNIQTIKDAKASNLEVTILQGNDYAMPYADLIMDMPLKGQKYSILDEQIPFYQIAIHGHKNYTGSSINMTGNYRAALLESAEYGSGLYFTFIASDPFVLQDTLYSRYYGTSYSDWSEKAIAMIQRYQADMAGLNQATIVNHETLAKDVTVTTYSNGTKVYVNYSSTAYSKNGVSIPAEDYVVKGGTK